MNNNEHEWSKIYNHLKDLISKFTSNGAVVSFLKSWLSSWKSDLFDTLEPYWNLLVHQPRRQHFIDVLAIDADEGNHHLHILQTLHGPSSQPALSNERFFLGSTWGLAMESDGTWWNYILGVGTWNHPQEFDGKTWENMEKQQTLQGLSGASK